VLSFGQIRTRYAADGGNEAVYGAALKRVAPVGENAGPDGAARPLFNQDVVGISRAGSCAGMVPPDGVVYRRSTDQVMPGQDVLLCRRAAGDGAKGEPVAAKFAGMTPGGFARFSGTDDLFGVHGRHGAPGAWLEFGSWVRRKGGGAGGEPSGPYEQVLRPSEAPRCRVADYFDTPRPETATANLRPNHVSGLRRALRNGGAGDVAGISLRVTGDPGESLTLRINR